MDERRLKRRGSWPQEFGGQYQTIANCARVLGRFATIAWQHGIGKHRNIELLQILLPMMANEGREIHNTCLWILRHRQGRWAYWVNEAIDNIVALAIDVIETTERGEKAIERGNWKEVISSVRFCMITGPKIEKWLLQGPPPDNGDIQVVADEIAEREWSNDERPWRG